MTVHAAIVGLLVAAAVALTACQTFHSTASGVPFRSLAKSDTSNALDLAMAENRNLLTTLMVKLYQKNPRELAKTPGATVPGMIRAVFDEDAADRFPSLGGRRDIACLELAFDPAFEGDRVLTLVYGLHTMLRTAYGDRDEYYAFDFIDAEKVFNAARNLETTLWLLNHRLDHGGLPLISANVTGPGTVNISYERLFGKLIGLNDFIADFLSGESHRLTRKSVTGIARFMFLPI